MDKVLLLLSVGAFLFLVAMMFLFSPSEVGTGGIFVFFVACYVLSFGLAVLCCRLFFLLRGKINKAKAGNINRKSYQYGLVIALAPVLLLLVSGAGTLPLWVVVGIVFIAECLLCFLVSRNIM